jgi:predicted RNA-binding protein
MKNYLFVCSRATYDIAASKEVIGFHDRTSTLNNELADLEKGDRIYFYITKEKILNGYATVTKSLFFDESKIYNALEELCVRRLGVKITKKSSVDFYSLVPKLSFIKKKKGVVWSAYLVKNLIKLNELDAKTLEATI